MSNENAQEAMTNANSTAEDRQFQLYKQLHEQFAVNDNNKTSNVISFLAAIFSVFIGYGYAFRHYKDDYYLEVATIASLLILALVSILCLFFGYSTRRDQFITQEIRERYGVILPYTSPFERNASRWSFLPDYYSIMLYACIVFMVALSITTVWRLSSKETNTIWMIVALAFLVLLTVCFFMDFYYGKYNDFKNRINYKNNSETMFKTDTWKNKWNYFRNHPILSIIIVSGFLVSLIVIIVVLINIVLYAWNKLAFCNYNDGSGIVDSKNLHAYLNVIGTLFLALMATLAFLESLRMRKVSSFNAIFTQLLSNHVAIFKNAAESNPIGSRLAVYSSFFMYPLYLQKNVFANFYCYYKIKRPSLKVEADLVKIWKDYCDKIITDDVKFSQAFKYVYHEVKIVYDEKTINNLLKEHYIKIIQANMSQDELFCYLINLLQHYIKNKGHDDEASKTEEHLEKLKKSGFFEDLILMGGKYGPAICELQCIPKIKQALELAFRQLPSPPENS